KASRPEAANARAACVRLRRRLAGRAGGVGIVVDVIARIMAPRCERSWCAGAVARAAPERREDGVWGPLFTRRSKRTRTGASRRRRGHAAPRAFTPACLAASAA